MVIDKVISVIIPAYNAERYIEQCLDSLYCQSYKNLEIIVVDDGSTDRTAEIADKFPVKLIKQNNQGVSAARNKGILEATGEYIHFMDADDYLNIHFYERLIESAIYTNSDVACCDLVHERLPKLTTLHKSEVVISTIEDKIWETNVINHGAVWKYIIKKSLITDNNHTFDTTLTIGEDQVFAFKLIYWTARVVIVPGATYFYKNRPGSAITAKSRLQVKIIAKKAKDIINNFATENTIDILKRSKYRMTIYKLFGFIPILSKRTYNTGRVRLYFLGVCILQIKDK